MNLIFNKWHLFDFIAMIRLWMHMIYEISDLIPEQERFRENIDQICRILDIDNSRLSSEISAVRCHSMDLDMKVDNFTVARGKRPAYLVISKKILSNGCIWMNVEEYVSHRDWLRNNVCWTPLTQGSTQCVNMGDRKNLVDDNIIILYWTKKNLFRRNWVCNGEFQIAWPSICINSCRNSLQECGWR